MANSRLRSAIRRLPLVSQLAAINRQQRVSLGFRAEFDSFARMSAKFPARFQLVWSDHRAYLEDKTATTGFDRHYIYHTAWAARILAAVKPGLHVDISSSLYFVGMVSAFLPVAFFDYRPARLELSNLNCGHADLLALPFADRSLPSISCMHVIEHIGLGRYGDTLDPSGDLKAMAELERVLAPGGTMLLVAPVGQPRIVFNAHRIYAFDGIVNNFANLELVEFALVPDDPGAGLIVRASASLVSKQDYGCGCFRFRRPQ